MHVCCRPARYVVAYLCCSGEAVRRLGAMCHPLARYGGVMSAPNLPATEPVSSEFAPRTPPTPVSVALSSLGPTQKPGRSVQDVATPREFLNAVQNRFGEFVWDLAADETNHVTDNWFGPGGVTEDAFEHSWGGLPNGLRWLNPPYGDIAPWAKRCAVVGNTFRPIALLVPASVGSNWFAEHVDGKARVLFLRPRLTFVGHTAPYPKDLILAVYGERPGYECWRWR